ncbi:hypothetical protein HMN09_00407400 [Mycena chlorophos]|uniref:Uncharacterized protein n=1 Tax=Mycena chlorophos TaxID=658473 RepID=A0A8H6WJ26_MYCCL|nr:hypothetical protein HMN09_00407400 [Mycena chlorophos]
MLSAAFDCDYDEDNDPFTTLLRNLSTPLPHLHNFIILELDFRRVYSESDLRTKLTRFVVAHCRAVLRRYEISREFTPFGPENNAGEAIYAFTSLLKYARPTRPLLLIIKNFDSLVFSTDGCQVLNEFLRELEYQCVDRTLGGVLLTSTENDGSLTPPKDRLGPPPYPMDLRSTWELTRHPAFQSVVGFTEQDIEDLDNAFRWKGSSGLRVVDMVKAEMHNIVAFADEDWEDRRLPPLDLEGHPCSTLRPQEILDLDWDLCSEEVYPANLVMMMLEKKYGFPRRNPLYD